MLEVRRTEQFDVWLRSLRDLAGKMRIIKRIERAAAGNMGDVAPVGDGVMEMRLFFGPGYRLYFVRRGERLVILLCGGDKASQSNDIERAKAIARELAAEELD